MKNLLLLFLSLFYLNLVAQEQDPALFQTWYLNSVMASDGSGDPIIVSQIDLDNPPLLIIMDDLTFNGIGACNTFDGNFIINNYNLPSTDQFTSSTNNCNNEIHNTFEDEYFGFMQYFNDYEIIPGSDGLELRAFNWIFGVAIFSNFQLSTKEFELRKLKIYPNPSNSKIQISNSDYNTKKVDFFNSLGQITKIVEHNFDNIDVSDLDDGIYILRINTNSGIFHKKIIKY